MPLLYLYIVHSLESGSLPRNWWWKEVSRLPCPGHIQDLCSALSPIESSSFHKAGGTGLCSSPLTRSVCKAQGQPEALGTERDGEHMATMTENPTQSSEMIRRRLQSDYRKITSSLLIWKVNFEHVLKKD